MRLSIVIPAVESFATLERGLVSVLEHQPDSCEIIVVLRRAYADPYELKSELKFLPVKRRAGLAECVNAGIDASTGDIVHVLYPGLEVTSGWCEPALAHFADRQVASVAPLIVERETARILAAGVQYLAGGMRRLAGAGQPASVFHEGPQPTLGPSFAAGFYRAAVLRRMGKAFAAGLGNLADVDLALRLRHLGATAIVDPRSCIAGDAGLFVERRGFRAGLRGERLFWRNASLIGWRRSLAAHVAAVTQNFVGELPHPAALTTLAGRGLAACQWGTWRRHGVELAALAAPDAAVSSVGPHVRIDAAHPTRPSREDYVKTPPS